MDERRETAMDFLNRMREEAVGVGSFDGGGELALGRGGGVSSDVRGIGIGLGRWDHRAMFSLGHG